MTFKSLICLLLMLSTAESATWFVNNQEGRDSNDGKSKDSPFATIARAVEAAGTSDKIVLANTGAPYREPFVLRDLGGTPDKPFIIEGNGAVLNGYYEPKPEEWSRVGEDLYFFETSVRSRETAYFMSRGEKIEKPPRSRRTTDENKLGPEEYFYRRDEGFYFRTEKGRSIESYELGLTLHLNGLALVNSSYVVCRNLVVEYFANDGFSLHGDCRGVVLKNVESRHNGDQGISIHSACELHVYNAYLHHNSMGIVDVNASRSYYNGVLIEHNRLGAGFNGGFHTLTDCIIRNNTSSQLNIANNPPTFLRGWESNPMGETTVFLQNVVISDETNNDRHPFGGIYIKGPHNIRLIMEHSVIYGAHVATHVIGGGEENIFCHLTKSVIMNCTYLFRNNTENFRYHGDYNVYSPAAVRWFDREYSAEELEIFLEAGGGDSRSRIGEVTVKKDGLVDETGELLTGDLQNIGPTFWLDTGAVFNELRFASPKTE